MRFKLPKIHLLINQDKEDSNKAINHVFVKENIAFAFSTEMIICVDLREYIKRELDIKETDDIQTLDELLSWFNGKLFTTEYWAELTKTNLVSLGNSGLIIQQDSFEKSLIYEVPLVNKDDIKAKLNLLKLILTRDSGSVDRVCVNSYPIIMLNKIFGSECKVDDFVFDFSGQDKQILFSLRLKEYIFGVITTNYDGANELHTFSNVFTFAENL